MLQRGTSLPINVSPTVLHFKSTSNELTHSGMSTKEYNIDWLPTKGTIEVLESNTATESGNKISDIGNNLI